MNFTAAIPNSVGSPVEVAAPEGGGKIIQRIRRAAGSNHSKARCMADADEDLVLQSQNGSPAAFDSLVRKHQRMVHSLTFRMTGSAADAEDLAQETFIRACGQINSFNGGAKFSTWLCSIAVHACLNWRRNEARRYQAHANCAEDMIGRQAETGIPPAESEMASRRRRR